MVRHSPKTLANPNPGNMNALLPCPIVYVFPLLFTSGNGLPEATIASPVPAFLHHL